jgi:hypothetical protein
VTATEADMRAPGTGTPKLNKALSQLQGELPQIKKTKTGKVEGENKQGKFFSYEYSYADLGDVVADVGPLLAKHGLAFHCGPTINPADRREMILLWSLLHESGEEKGGEWPLGPANQKPQSLGSAITYGRRYCFTAATNIVLEDDDDGQRAQKEHDTRQSAGDLWETATPARPARQQPADGNTRAEGDGPSWYRRKLAEADTVKTDAAVDRLGREAADGAKKGLCTPAQATHIQNRAELRLRKLKLDATPVDVEDLARAAQDSPTPPGDEADERHRRLVGAVQGQFKRLGFAIDDGDREERVITIARLARIAYDPDKYASTSDFEEDDLKAAARELSRRKNREALDALLKAGEVDG